MVVPNIITYLETVSSLTTLLPFHPRAPMKHAIYANVPAENTESPFILVSMADGEPVRHLQSMDAGLADALVDVEIFTESLEGYAGPNGIDAVREELRKALTTKGATWGSLAVQSCSLSYIRDFDFAPPEKSNEWIQQGGWQLNMWYEQTPVLT